MALPSPWSRETAKAQPLNPDSQGKGLLHKAFHFNWSLPCHYSSSSSSAVLLSSSSQHHKPTSSGLSSCRVGPKPKYQLIQPPLISLHVRLQETQHCHTSTDSNVSVSTPLHSLHQQQQAAEQLARSQRSFLHETQATATFSAPPHPSAKIASLQSSLSIGSQLQMQKCEEKDFLS